MEENDIKRMPTRCGDKTCPSCVIAGDYIFLSHHAGGFEKREIKHQTRAAFESAKKTLAAAGAALCDMVQIHLYLSDLSDFDGAVEAFNEYFDENCFPARTTTVSEFLDKECLVQIDGIAYKKITPPFEIFDPCANFCKISDANANLAILLPE